MGGLGEIFASLFSRPRLTWAALFAAAGIFLYLQTIGVGPSVGGSLGQPSQITAWTVLLVSGAFFVLTILIDLWNSAAKAIAEAKSKTRASARFHTLSSGARALLSYLAFHNEDSAWLTPNYAAAGELVIRGIASITQRSGSAIRLTVNFSDLEWLRNNLHSLTDEQAGSQSQADLFAAFDVAQQALGRA